jgi:hypothetical protein
MESARRILALMDCRCGLAPRREFIKAPRTNRRSDSSKPDAARKVPTYLPLSTIRIGQSPLARPYLPARPRSLPMRKLLSASFHSEPLVCELASPKRRSSRAGLGIVQQLALAGPHSCDGIWTRGKSHCRSSMHVRSERVKYPERKRRPEPADPGTHAVGAVTWTRRIGSACERRRRKARGGPLLTSYPDAFQSVAALLGTCQPLCIKRCGQVKAQSSRTSPELPWVCVARSEPLGCGG